MGKVKWNTKASEIDEAEDSGAQFEPYDGPIPPKNAVLRLALKWARVTAFNSGNGGLTMLFEVAEPKSSPKAKYNGCPIFNRLVDVDTQTFKIKQFMSAIGGTGRHWAATVTTKDDRDNEVVVKWGNVMAEGLYVRAQMDRETYEGEPRAVVGRFLPKREDEEMAEDDAEAGDDSTDLDEPPF
jgi:hypothetical protein